MLTRHSSISKSCPNIDQPQRNIVICATLCVNFSSKSKATTVKPANSGYTCLNGHLVIADIFFKGPAESRSNSHRKTSIQRTLLQRTFVIADTFFRQIYKLIAGTLWLVGKIENTWMFLFYTFLYFNRKHII